MLLLAFRPELYLANYNHSPFLYMYMTKIYLLIVLIDCPTNDAVELRVYLFPLDGTCVIFKIKVRTIPDGGRRRSRDTGRGHMTFIVAFKRNCRTP